LAGRSLQSNAQHMEQMRNRLLANLQAHLGEVNVRPNGPFNPSLRLPNTLSVGFRLIHSGDLLADIGHQVAASAGATCHSAGSVSSVLRAMQVPDEFARGTLRLSLGPTTRATDVDRAAAIIAEGVKKQLDSRKTAMSQ
jgi:cysteine desulfurase